MYKSKLPVLACILFLISGILMLAAAVRFLHSSDSLHQPYIPEAADLSASSADSPQAAAVSPPVSAAHEDRAWITGIFNCLQLFFGK